MSSKNELREKLLQLSKEELVDLIIELMTRLEKVEAKLAQYENPNTPSSRLRFKPKTESDPSKPRFPGAPEGRQGSGVCVPKPDKTEEHTLKESDLRHVGWRTQIVIDFVNKPIQVTKHIIHQYMRKDGSIIEPPVDLPSGIYGKNIQAFTTLLHGIGGVSFEKIGEFLRALRPDLSICPATILNHVDNIAKQLQPQRDYIQQSIRASSFVNADETSMRKDGQNGYNWVFCTPNQVLYETDLSRGREVTEKILGTNYNGVVVSDGYIVYTHYKQQRCWAHILREADSLITINPEAGPPARYLHKIFEKAKAAKKIKRLHNRQTVAKTLAGATELKHVIACLQNAEGCKKFATTLKNAAPNLFTGVINPQIPLDNNDAERKLRPLIVDRNLMGCYRNEKGERFFENVMSSLMTWKLQGKKLHQTLVHYAR